MEGESNKFADIICIIQLTIQEFVMFGYILTSAAHGALEMIFK